MDPTLAAVAEQLAAEFGDLQSRDVVRVVTECVDEFPEVGPHFVAQAARARLSAERFENWRSRE